jgi:hypothetical protein
MHHLPVDITMHSEYINILKKSGGVLTPESLPIPFPPSVSKKRKE